MRSILTLDLATKTGWAFAPAGLVMMWPTTAFEAHADHVIARQVQGGSKKIEASELGRAYAEFGGWLEDKLQVMRPDLVVFEAPLPRHSSADAARKLLGLAAIAEYVTRRAGVTVRECAVGSIRKHFVGTGCLPKGQAKNFIIAECRARGFRPKDDNHADAIALLDKCAVDVVVAAERSGKST